MFIFSLLSLVDRTFPSDFLKVDVPFELIRPLVLALGLLDNVEVPDRLGTDLSSLGRMSYLEDVRFFVEADLLLPKRKLDDSFLGGCLTGGFSVRLRVDG